MYYGERSVTWDENVRRINQFTGETSAVHEEICLELDVVALRDS